VEKSSISPVLAVCRAGFLLSAAQTAELIDNLQGGLEILLKRRMSPLHAFAGMLKGARREENVMSAKTVVDLFTPEEHRILSSWLEVEPEAECQPPPIKDALRRLGFEDDPGLPYSNVHAAVAFIVLEPVEKRLPQWSCVDEDNEIQFARALGKLEIVPERAPSGLLVRTPSIGGAYIVVLDSYSPGAYKDCSRLDLRP
jgi:hypothetical protein